MFNFGRKNCCGGGCNNGCNNNGCNPCGGGCRCNNCPRPCTPRLDVCYCSRYVEMPMRIVYGSGYTELDCCEDTLEVLEDISHTLKQGLRQSNCGSCGCGNSCCGCR